MQVLPSPVPALEASHSFQIHMQNAERFSKDAPSSVTPAGRPSRLLCLQEQRRPHHVLPQPPHLIPLPPVRSSLAGFSPGATPPPSPWDEPLEDEAPRGQSLACPLHLQLLQHFWARSRNSVTAVSKCVKVYEGYTEQKKTSKQLRKWSLLVFALNSIKFHFLKKNLYQVIYYIF